MSKKTVWLRWMYDVNFSGSSGLRKQYSLQIWRDINYSSKRNSKINKSQIKKIELQR
jgi:hypothetical protein